MLMKLLVTILVPLVRATVWPLSQLLVLPCAMLSLTLDRQH